jgi:ATP-binding cassette subfamily B protein
MQGISAAAESIGLRTLGAKLSFEKLKNEVPIPCIVHWNQSHFVVVYGIKKNTVLVADPEAGLLTYKNDEFLKSWAVEDNVGVALLLEPTQEFYENEIVPDRTTSTGLKYLLNQLTVHKKLIIQLLIGLLFGSVIQLGLPFLTQSIVDIGINGKNIHFIYLVLLAQLTLVISSSFAEFARRWVLVQLSAKINLAIISDFLNKLMKLPMGFFDTKKTGDILQRIEDHSRIERFVNSSSLSILFSFFSIIVFSIVLANYSLEIFLVFLLGSSFYILYVLFFLRARKELDYKRFNEMARNRTSLLQLIGGIQEIKLNNSERSKRWEWERIQGLLYKLTLQSTKLQQWQEGGSSLLTELKNILITFLAAKTVVSGEMTLGMMLAIQFIIGQLNAPINDFVSFIRELQDARISLDRIGEIHLMENEEKEGQLSVSDGILHSDIHLDGVTFQYEGPSSPKALDNINLRIENGKVTAIVGSSGSGKTTLLKTLLRYYPPTEGRISLGSINLEEISPMAWRSHCGTVLQDGFIFSDSIKNNVCLEAEGKNENKFNNALRIANIDDFVERLPLGPDTIIGSEGTGISAGQKQRILIARAVFKNPDYLFFDEATSALDSNNERLIIDNLNEFFKGKTVLVIAHRLSTVKKADKIVVLEKGRIVEEGTHENLVKKKGMYFELIKNQLELGD